MSVQSKCVCFLELEHSFKLCGTLACKWQYSKIGCCLSLLLTYYLGCRLSKYIHTYVLSRWLQDENWKLNFYLALWTAVDEHWDKQSTHQDWTFLLLEDQNFSKFDLNKFQWWTLNRMCKLSRLRNHSVITSLREGAISQLVVELYSLQSCTCDHGFTDCSYI